MSALPPLEFSRPEALFLLALVPLFWLWQRQAVRQAFSSLSSALLLLFHSLLLTLLIVSAADLRVVKKGQPSSPLLLIDVSNSLTAGQRDWIQTTIMQDLHPAADALVLPFAGNHSRLSWKEAQALLANPPSDLQPEETNLEKLLTSLVVEDQAGSQQSTRQQATARSAFLFTDGWETKGETRSILPLLAEKGLKIYPFAPPQAETLPNVSIPHLYMPQLATGGETIQVGISLENTNPHPVQGELTLHQGEKLLLRKDIALASGSSLIPHPLLLSKSGLIPLTASFSPQNAAEDTLAQDNQATSWVNVSAVQQVMLLSGQARDNRYLEQALSNRGLGVTAVALSDSPVNLPSLQSFGAVILNNVAKNRLPAALLASIEEYVNKGGGLIMVGGEKSLGLGGYKGSVVEKVLPIALKPPEKEERYTAVILILDKSGSMRKENKLLYAKEGAKTVAHNLKDSDLFGVIGFDKLPFVVVPLDYLGKRRETIPQRIDRLKPSGGTFLMPALLEAKRQLERKFALRKNIIILTDGETGGSGSDYLDLVRAMHYEQKMTISTVAVGDQPNLRLLSRLATYGGGAFHHTYDPTSLPNIFLGELEEKPEEKTLVEKRLTPVPTKTSPLLKGIADKLLPPVKGYVGTELKKKARLDLALRDEGKRQPLLASWSYGQGKTVAFTSDANGRWSAPWITWNLFSQFWAQVVDWSLPGKEKKEGDLGVDIGHDNGNLFVELFFYSETEDGLGALAQITGPHGKDIPLALERLAPGHYKGTYATKTEGDYRLQVTLPTGEDLGPLKYTLPPAHSAEVPKPLPNLDLLETIAKATGGSLPPDFASVPQPEGALETHPLLPYLISLAMALYLVELIVRRVI